jgi:hypothetical protein
MLNNEGSASTPVIVLNPVSAANTAAATSGWIDVRAFEGEIEITQHIGAVTGSITGAIEDATDGSGTGAAALTGAAFTVVSSANNIQKLAINASQPRGWIRYVGTIVTGPALAAVSLRGRNKYT